MGPASLARVAQARQKANALWVLRRDGPTTDVEGLIADLGIPIVRGSLPAKTRGTVGDVSGQPVIILNRHYRFTSQAERRWVLAEELGHVLLEHRRVESTVPGSAVVSAEAHRGIYEREARAFAAELLMPLAEVRRRWMSAPPLLDKYGHEDMSGRVKRLARTFAVSLSAMRIRLKELRLL